MLRKLIAFTLLVGATYAPAESYVFTNGNLVTMNSPAATAGELVAVDGKIAAVGQNLPRPDGAVVVDMDGGYLMPGLAEMHAHVPSPSLGLAYRDEVLFLWVAWGITTAKGMLGHPDHLALRDDLLAHKVLGPRLFTSGPSFNSNSVRSAARAVQMVEEQHRLGYDFLKIHPGMNRAQFDAMAATAHRLRIAFAGHVPADVGLTQALSEGQLTIDHLDGFVQELVPNLKANDPALNSFFAAALVDQADETMADPIIRKMLEARAWVVPTETLFENFAAADDIDELSARPEIIYLPQSLRDNYTRALSGAASSAAATQRYVELRKRMLKAMHDHGVGILLGSDSPQIFNVPGFSIHRELRAMVSAGLSPYEALQTGTVNPAKFFERDNEVGRLAAGLVADLVLVAGNPLQDISNAANVKGVMVRGRWLDSNERSRKLAEIAKRYAN